jgi:hypothetical protein
MNIKKVSARAAMLLVVASAVGATVAVPRKAARAAGDLPMLANRLATPAKTVAAASVQGQASAERRQLVRVFVHADDIYPDEITVGPGKILIVAENETQSDISLIVEKVNPGHAPEGAAKLDARQFDRRNKQELTLGVGEYVFYAESNPAVKGKLIVDPQHR